MIMLPSFAVEYLILELYPTMILKYRCLALRSAYLKAADLNVPLRVVLYSVRFGPGLEIAFQAQGEGLQGRPEPNIFLINSWTFVGQYVL